MVHQNAVGEHCCALCGAPSTTLDTTRSGERFWPYLFTQAAHISNRLPTYAHKPPVSPIEKVTGKPPTLKMFKNRVPLCDIWVRINNPEDQISKLSARNVKAKYLCWDERRGGDLVYIQELNRTATAYHSTPLPRNCTIVGEPVKLRSRLERDGDVRTAVNTPDPMDNLSGMPGRPTVRRGEAPGLEAMRSITVRLGQRRVVGLGPAAQREIELETDACERAHIS